MQQLYAEGTLEQERTVIRMHRDRKACIVCFGEKLSAV